MTTKLEFVSPFPVSKQKLLIWRIVFFVLLNDISSFYEYVII